MEYKITITPCPPEREEEMRLALRKVVEKAQQPREKPKTKRKKD